jgi:hypothetical protein
MGRLVGLVLVVAGIWAMTEVYLKGTEQAFGGLLATGEASDAPGDAGGGGLPRATLGLRVKDRVEAARQAENERTERLLSE